ncbi:hypothetical protein HYR54_14690 [Candidatus Acetothermia bacterium]|nr:hypothetical protein [Candidatus Acetothermia bacterium]
MDLWSDFAIALATRQVLDAKGLYARAEQETQYVPVPAFVGDWGGQSLTIDKVNWQNPFLQFCEKKKGYCLPARDVAATGSPLIVRHPYGIHFLRVVPKSNEPFVLRFEGASDTDFKVHLVVLNNSGVYENFSLTQDCVVSNPMTYKLLQIVITRGEKGLGSYKIIMDNVQNNQYPQCFSEKK